MKKLLSILLVLLLCLGIMTACGGGDNGNSADAALDGAVDAVEALFTSTQTAEDYTLAGSVTVDGVTYTVTWAISNTEGVTLDGNNVTVADKPATAIAYTLTATVADAAGNTKTATINLTVPAYVAQYNTWAEYAAAENGATLKVSGVVSAVLKDAFAIVKDGKAFIVKGTVADGVALGVTVDVEGTKATDAAGNYSIGSATVTVTNATPATVPAADYTTIFTDAAGVNAEALVANQGLLVVIKGATIGAYTSTAKTAAFSIGDNATYLSLKGLCPLTTAQVNAVRDTHNDFAGDYIDVTGIIQIDANGNMYLVAAGTDCESGYRAREYTDAEKVALIKNAIKLDSVYNMAATVTVPTAGEKGGTVAWASNNDAITYAEGKLTVTIPNVYTEVTVTATITSGSVTEAVEYKVVLSTLENTIDVLKAAYALEAGKALPIANKTVEGMVTAIDTTNGVVVTLVVKNNTAYPITVALTGETAATVVAGDTIMVTGQVKKNADGVVILDGATLDKISSGGNKLTFDLALPSDKVLFLNVKGSDTNTVTVVDDGGDKVLQINKPNGGTVGNKQTAVDYFYPALSEGDNVYVFEAAITLIPTEGNTGRFETCFYTTEGESLNKVFQVEYIFNNTAGSAIKAKGYGKIGNAQVSTAEVTTTATVGTEFTVRMEYHVDETAPRTVVYINDARVIDTTTVFFAEQNGVGTKPVTVVTHAEMQAYTAYTGLVNIDDLNVYTFASTYTFDDTYENDQVFVDLKPWKANSVESKNNFEIVTDGTNKYLKVNKLNDGGKNCQVAVDVFDPDNKQPDRVGYAEFSGKLNVTRTSTSGDFEILVRAEKDDDGINDPNDAQAKVAEVIIYFGAEGAMTAKLNGRSGGASSSTVTLAPKQGEWFTFKLVYEVKSDSECLVTFYVNGEKVLEGVNNACLDPSNNGKVRYDSKFAEIQAYTAFAGTVLYDDLAVDFKSAPIEWTAATPGNPTAGELNADLGTLGTANNADFTAAKTTTAGWVANNAQYVVDNATAGTAAIVLNGNKASAGTLTSPTLTNGVSKVVFGYAALDAKEIAIKVEILKDGSAVNSITSYIKVNKNTAYTYEWVLDTPIGGDYQIKITNLALGKAEEDAELIAIWNVTYEVATLPSYADFDFEKAGDKTNLIATGGVTVENGKMNINTASGNVHTGFIVPNHAEKNEYSDVYQYVVKFDFTFNGAKVKAKETKNETTGEITYSYDLNLAFVGFVKDSSGTGNGNMPYWGYLGMVAPKENGAEATGVTLYGLTFQKGETYKVEIRYVVDSGKYVITATDSKGETKTNTFAASNTAAIKENDNTMYGFNFYWRGGGTQRFTDASVTFDNAYIGIEAAPNNGRNGISKYAENSVNFNDLDDTTLSEALTGGVAGTVGGTMKEDVTSSGNWVSVIGAVGSNKYVSFGHTGGSSASAKFKAVDGGKNKEFKVDTMVVEFDFMIDDSGYVKRTVDGVTVYDKIDWAVKFVFSLKQDMNVTVTPTPAKPAVEEVKDETGAVVTPAQAAVPGSFSVFGKSGLEFDKWYTIRVELSPDAEFTVEDKTYHKVAVAYYINNEKISSTVRTDWATAAKNWEAIDGFYANTRGYCQYVSAGIDNVHVAKYTAGYEPSLKDVETPAAATGYKYYVNQTTAKKTVAFAGAIANDYYYGTTEALAEATDVYLEAAADAGYLMYFMNGDVKTYFKANVNGTKTNLSFVTDAAEATVWTYNATIKGMTTTLKVNDTDTVYYIGTYGTYTTLSLSAISYVLDDQGATKPAFDTSSFVAHFAIYE